MAKVEVAKDQLYGEITDAIQNARESVRFYSVSCCFGFYSFGIRTLEQVLHAIWGRLCTQVAGKFVEVRVVIKIDNDNSMDTYAAGRFKKLESRLPQPRDVFREMSTATGEEEMIQFVIVDGRRIVVSGKQYGEWNDTLDLLLNKTQAGSRFDRQDDETSFNAYAALF